MCSIIGFGGWNSSYFYFILAAFSKLIKEEIFIGEDSKFSLNLHISQHKLMILLLGYLSDVFFSFLLYMFLVYRDYKRTMKRNSLLYYEGIEYKKQTTLDLLFQKTIKYEIKDNNFDFEKNQIKLNSTDSLNITENDSSSNSNSSSNELNKTKTNISGRKVSLIHNDLLRNIGDKSFKYILLSSFLINGKEYLYQIVYSTNDIFDYYFLHLVVITLILRFIFKKKIYKHQMLAVIIVVLVSGFCLISCLFIDNFNEDENKRNFIDIFKGEYYKIFILISVYCILSICFCSGIIIQKNLMEIKFISPYKILLYKGLLGFIGAIFGLIISSNFQCKEALSDKEKGITDKKIFEFFVCTNEYNHNYYYDHFISYFVSFENSSRIKESIVLILYCILHFITEFSLILINKFLSPTHYLIAESFYSLIHIPFHYLSNETYDELKELGNDVSKVNLLNLYNAIFHTLKTRILRFISCICDFICFMIYLEIIELKFCELNKNIKKNIQKRASIDGIIVEDDNSSSGSDDEDNIENKENKEKKEGKNIDSQNYLL